MPFSGKIISDKLKNLNEFEFLEQKRGQFLNQYNDELKIKL